MNRDKVGLAGVVFGVLLWIKDRWLLLMRLCSGILLQAFKWHESSTIVLNKSKFKGFCIPIKSQSELAPLLQQLIESDKNVAKATHPAMLAWKTAIGDGGNLGELGSLKSSKKQQKKKKSTDSKSNNNTLENDVSVRKISSLNQGMNDCGEGGSGDRIMGLLDRCRLINVLVVVTRWYGGTPLGPARFRCISDAAAECLRNAGYLSVKPKFKDGYIDCLRFK